jgi:hypothetical protein
MIATEMVPPGDKYRFSNSLNLYFLQIANTLMTNFDGM